MLVLVSEPTSPIKPLIEFDPDAVKPYKRRRRGQSVADARLAYYKRITEYCIREYLKEEQRQLKRLCGHDPDHPMEEHWALVARRILKIWNGRKDCFHILKIKVTNKQR